MKWYKVRYSVSFPMYANIKGNEKDPTSLSHFLTDGEGIEEDWTKYLFNQKGEFIAEFRGDETPGDIEDTLNNVFNLYNWRKRRRI